MNLLNEKEEVTSKTEIEQVQQKEVEYKLLGKVLRRPGLKLFGFYFNTGQVKEIKIEKRTMAKLLPKDGKLVKAETSDEKCVVENGVVYFEALNLKSAISRVTKAVKGKKKLQNLRGAR